MHGELKRTERENKLLEEKLKSLQSELGLSNNKSAKYKKIAKAFKSNLEQIEESFANLKRMS
jgi:ATP-dependent Lon protease